MPNFASITLIGHIGQAPELKFSGAGKPVLRFSLAVNTGYGEHKNTSWYRCAMFGDRAQKVEPMLARGKPVLVQGEPCVRDWESNGKKGTSVEVVVRELTLLGAKPADHAQPEGDWPEPAQGQPDRSPSYPEGVPF